MSYEKQHFEDGMVLKAEHLNHIEDGIAELAEGGGSSGSSGTLYEHFIRLYKAGSPVEMGDYEVSIRFSFISKSPEHITVFEDAVRLLGLFDGTDSYADAIRTYHGYVYDLADTLQHYSINELDFSFGVSPLTVFGPNWTSVLLDQYNTSITDTVKEIV